MNIYITVLVISIFSISAVNLKEPVCGRPIGLEFRLEEDRIVAGYDIGYYRYPWYAALVSYNMVSCGAALIAPRTILTAAHCYKEYINLANKGIMPLESIYTVKLGVYNICQTEQTQKQYAVEKVHIHDLYTKKRPYYDICLLKLIGNTDQYMPICLPPPSLKKKPLDGTVPGLGTLRYKGAMPCTVHEARLLIHNDSICHAMLNSTGNDANAIDKAFCAGYLQGGIDTCQGDSGGPLQSMNHNGDYILIGIVSFGFRCADPGLLGMYTDVSEYIDWIKEKSGKDVPTSISSFVEMPPTGSDVTNINTGGNSNNGGGGGNNGGGGGGSNGGGGGSGGHHHHHHGGIHLLRPYRRPIKLIIYKDKHLHPVTKLYLHHPIIRKMP